MVRITLIRHAESLANVGRAAGSFSGCPLTAEGEHQAEALAASWQKAPDLIIRSPFVRTIQTSLPTIRRFPHVPVEDWPVHEFTNLETARWDGSLPEDRAAHVARFWQNCDPAYCDGPTAESFAMFAARTLKALRRFEALPDGTHAFVFSHGFAMHMMRLQVLLPHFTEQEWMRVFVDEWNQRPIPNTARFDLIWDGTRWTVNENNPSLQDA